MKASELREKSVEDLNKDLLSLREDQAQGGATRSKETLIRSTSPT